MVIEKNEFCAVIKNFYLKDLTPKKIKTELVELQGTSTPVFTTVYNWINEFKRDDIVFSIRGIKVYKIVEEMAYRTRYSF